MTQFARNRKAFSLMEIMVALTIVALMSTMASQQYFNSMAKARVNTCQLNVAEIEVQVERFFRNRNRWPRRNLSDMRRDAKYFSDGIPTCPVTGKPYRLDPKTHKVIKHNH